MIQQEKHRYGEFESVKFAHRRESYYRYLDRLKQANIPTEDLLEHFTAYVGHMSLNRALTLYELYKKTQHLAGHIAEVGVYRGAGSLLFAKLVKIFESESLTQVHGFDWFKGTGRGGGRDAGDLVPEGGYCQDYQELVELVEAQGYSNILKLHNLDVIAELSAFMVQHPHLHFRLVFMDAGMYDVMKAAIPAFWERLLPGGIMIFDQFAHELAPGEIAAVRECLPDMQILKLGNSWMPNAYIIKPCADTDRLKLCQY